MIELRVDGPPRGKGRPRFDPRSRRAYTDNATQRAEGSVQIAWIMAGRPRMEDGPIALLVEVVMRRPESHWKRNGTLSAAGERSTWPTKKPDWDNVAKLVADALNGAAYRDDSQIVTAHTIKRWANPGEHEHTRIVIREMPELAPVLRPAIRCNHPTHYFGDDVQCDCERKAA